MFWFNQRADLPKQMAEEVQQTLIMKEAGMWVVYGLIVFDVLFVALGGYFIYRKRKFSKIQDPSSFKVEEK